jgi:hypothetical protein
MSRLKAPSDFDFILSYAATNPKRTIWDEREATEKRAQEIGEVDALPDYI